MAAAVTVAQFVVPVRPGWNRARLDGQGRSVDPDAQLVERCLAGEEAAWENLVKTHTRRVYAVCYRFTSSDQQAQDLTQDVFLRVFRNLKTFRSGEGSFTIWLTRLTRNLLIDHYRRSRM